MYGGGRGEGGEGRKEEGRRGKLDMYLIDRTRCVSYRSYLGPS